MINSELALEHATDDDPWATEYLHRHPAGSGVYQVERWEPGQQLVYRRNPQWASGALPSAERIILREVPSSATRRALLERGNAHLSQDVPPRDALELDAHPNVQVVSTPIENCLHVLCPNLAFEPFQDVHVPQAIAWAIPYDAILQNAPTVAGCRCGAPRAAPLPIPIGHSRSPTTPTSSAPGLDDPAYAPKIRRMIEIAFEDVPRIPLYQPALNVAMGQNLDGYTFWYHRQLDTRVLQTA